MHTKPAWSFGAERGPTQDFEDEPSHIHIPRPSRLVRTPKASEAQAEPVARDAAKVLVEA